MLTLDEGGGGRLRRVDGGQPITRDAWAHAQLHVFSIWSPDGRCILSNARMPGSVPSMAVILDADTGHVLQPLAESWAVHGEFSADGRRLVSAHTDYTLRLWHRRWAESHSRVMGIAAAIAIGLLALLTAGSALGDTARSKGRDQIRSLPRTLRLAAWGWGLLAAVALADTAAATFTGELGMRWWMPPAFLVCLLFAIGLLRRNRAWRVLAKWCLWASMASLCLLWAHLPPQTGPAPASIPTRLYGMPLDVPTSLVVPVYLLLLAFVIAQLVVLVSERVRAVFRGIPTSAAGDSSEKESCGGRNGLRPDGAA